MAHSPFNDYDSLGNRTDRNGYRRYIRVDENVIDNIRQAWPELKGFSDTQILNQYYDFSYHNEEPDEDGFPAWIRAQENES